MSREEGPLEPSLVKWFFDNRLTAKPTGFTPHQNAANDRLWLYLCEYNAPPSSGWLKENNRVPDSISS